MRLRDLRRPPPLWVAGDRSVLARRSVAVVGTRRVSGYGERVAHELALALARAGLVVVSGLAQGIDSVAHAAALQVGPSVAVLGQGITSFRAEVSGGRKRIADRCVLASPYPPEMPALRWMFARRNEVIAALAEAVVVVEAPLGSGALITAAFARRLGRALFVVPGPLGSSAALGSNGLLAQGTARMLLSVDALCAELGIAPPNPPVGGASLLADALAAGPLSPDALARALGIRLGEMAVRVAADPRVVMLADGRFARRAERET